MEDKDIFDNSFYEKDENVVKDNDVVYEFNSDESCQEFGGSDACYQTRKTSKKEEILVNVIGTLAVIVFCVGVVFICSNVRDKTLCPRCGEELNISLGDRFFNDSSVACKTCEYKFPVKNKTFIGFSCVIIDKEQLHEDSIHYHRNIKNSISFEYRKDENLYKL